MTQMIKLMHQRPTTAAILILAATLVPTWLLTMDGGLLQMVGL